MRLPIFLGFSGYSLSKKTIEFWEKVNPIGTILFQSNIKNKQQLAQLTLQIKEIFPEMLLAIDAEGGAINRFSDDIPAITSAKSMGRKINWDFIQQSLQLLAEVLANFHFDINLAPVLDLETEQSSPAIRNRGFFPDSQLINEYNRIFVEQHNNKGIYCVGKHFPGLYKITQDPHYQQSIFEGNNNDLELSLDCYTNLLEQPLQGIMTSHILYPELDNKQATISNKIATELLQNKLKFQGMLFTDCLEMSAISNLASPDVIAYQTLEAGHHLLISSYQLKKELSFQEKLVEGIKKFIEKNPTKADYLQNKINQWQELILANKSFKNRKYSKY